MRHERPDVLRRRHPARGLARLPLRTDTLGPARARSLRSPLARIDFSTGVWARVRAWAEQEPDRVAVVSDDGTATYRQLGHRVQQVRAALLAESCVPGSRIAVAGTRGIDTIAMFLAIESLGATYLPLAPDWPPAWTVSVLRRAESHCVLVSGTTDVPSVTAAHAASETAVPLVVLPSPTAGVAPDERHTPARVATSDEPRYVIHTSGSTGLPKGVVVNQLGLMNHLWFLVRRLRLTAADKVAFTAPPTYVISVWQMLAPLLVGGSVVIVADADLRFARRLASTVERTGVTVMELVPTVIGWAVHEAGRLGTARAFANLRCLISTGERLDPGIAGDALRLLPHVEFFNAYGATECSDDVALHQVTADDLAAPPLPVGKPASGVVLYLLVHEDGTWRAAEPGEAGELWVGGDAVSAGYLHDPQRTAESFFVDEFDPTSRTGRLYRTGDLARFDNGIAYCLGRADRQVKIGGVRIELDEVEGALSRLPGVLECAVLAEVRDGVAQLVAYLVADREVPRDTALDALRTTLPAALVPQRWVQLEALPTNGSGKIDYRALRTGPGVEPA
ncbi:D-alanine--poly(phosphoribitol) ligase subunit 1 [Kitasatospora sp. GP30]|uniref:amino acid adenylation domain-containing protein n=1 Tax=Kitasatospora sp. GP30 TaxID=3035084 RepID=UPI000C70A4B0|nr:amino acid adenylation domain-containing protein [Kitasatospora sp. GP30]MDH6145169.1 D-alanine--poly(phosphoribitol) ligase subunit 1 [Kitasatospora sp. GP30]